MRNKWRLLSNDNCSPGNNNDNRRLNKWAISYIERLYQNSLTI